MNGTKTERVVELVVDYKRVAELAVSKGEQTLLVGSLVHALVDSKIWRHSYSLKDTTLLNWALRKMKENRLEGLPEELHSDVPPE